MSDIKKDAEKSKQAADAARAAQKPSGGKMTGAERAAMLRGSDSKGKDAAQEVGLRAYYKPAKFPQNKKGELLDAEGNPTAPEIHCIPIDVIENDGSKTKFKNPDGTPKGFCQILVLTKSPCYVVDEDDNEVFVPAGSALMLMSSAALAGVEKVARNRTHTQEMWMRPLRLRELDGGNKIWDWSIKAAPVMLLRGTEVQLPAAPAAPEQLPAN